MLKSIVYLLIFCIGCVHCADFFESTFLLRLECYKQKQKGCNEEFTDAYPDMAWSSTNLTKATTYFYMFPQNCTDEPELMHKCGGRLPNNTKFNPKCRTEIFIPGFISGICNYAIFRELKNERLKSGCYNVLLIDYMWGNSPDLVVAQQNLKIVAKQVAQVIKNLKDQFNLTKDHFICTGHSYGAHACGFVGQLVTISVINGIEPAGVVLTNNTDLNDRLDRGDADCVQVMHCNAGQCLPLFFGVNFSCGTQDFYINGGLFQVSCYRQILISLIKTDFIYAIFSLFSSAACSHFQCLQYYKASMNPDKCQFVGIECENEKACKAREALQKSQPTDCGKNGENCAVMGAYGCDCNKDKEGKNYFLNTKCECPFCDNSQINTDGLSCNATIIN